MISISPKLEPLGNFSISQYELDFEIGQISTCTLILVMSNPAGFESPIFEQMNNLADVLGQEITVQVCTDKKVPVLPLIPTPTDLDFTGIVWDINFNPQNLAIEAGGGADLKASSALNLKGGTINLN